MSQRPPGTQKYPGDAMHAGTRRPVALSAMIAGTILCAAAAVVWWRALHVPAPYRYVIGAPLAAVDLGPLASLAERRIAVRSASVVATDGSTLVDLEVADAPSGPVLVKWKARVDGPFLKSPPSPQDIANLAPVLERHVPPGTALLAWWDSSRELRMLADVKVAFGEHLGIPLFVPTEWRGARARIGSVEAAFWNTHSDSAERTRFRQFVDALLADETQGVAALLKLADTQPAVLALNVRDVVLLAQLAPQRIGIALHDFPASGDVHGMVRSAHAWLDEHGYTAYTIVPLDDRRVRVLALTDKKSGTTLAVRLLPFVGNNQDAVAGTTLVYQTGGFWVYELGADKGAAEVLSSLP